MFWLQEKPCSPAGTGHRSQEWELLVQRPKQPNGTAALWVAPASLSFALLPFHTYKEETCISISLMKIEIMWRKFCFSGAFDPLITMSIICTPFCNLYSSLIVQFLLFGWFKGFTLFLTNTERSDQIWGQFPNSLLVRKWSLFLKMRDWQLLTLQNWTTLPLFKQNVFPEQVVGKPHCRFPALFLLASRWCCECKCATSC